MWSAGRRIYRLKFVLRRYESYSVTPTTSYSLVTKQAVTRELLAKWFIPTTFSNRKMWQWFIRGSGSLAPEESHDRAKTRLAAPARESTTSNQSKPAHVCHIAVYTYVIYYAVSITQLSKQHIQQEQINTHTTTDICIHIYMYISNDRSLHPSMYLSSNAGITMRALSHKRTHIV